MSSQIYLPQSEQLDGWQSVALSVVWHIMLLALLPLWLAELSVTKSPDNTPDNTPAIVHFIEIQPIPEPEQPPQKLVKEEIKAHAPKPAASLASKPVQQTITTETNPNVPVTPNVTPTNPPEQLVKTASDEAVGPLTSSPIAHSEGIATDAMSHHNATSDIKQSSLVVSSELIETKPKGPATLEDLHGVEESFATLVRERIAATKTYPASARERKFEGKALISFTLNKNGQIIDLAVNTSSGYETLDYAAVQAVKRAGPFPPIPEKLGRETIAFNLPISFTLR